MPLQFFRRVSAFLLVVLVFANTVQFGLLSSIVPIGVTGLTIIFFMFAIVIVVARRVEDRTVKSLMIWGYSFATIAAVRQITAANQSGPLVEVGLLCSFLLLLLSASIILADRNALRTAKKTLFAVTSLSVLINIYEFMNPGTFSTVAGRAAGLYQNPNTSGTMLVMGMILSTAVLPAKFRTLFQLFVGVGVAATVSRGGLVGWLCAVVLLQLMGSSKKQRIQSVLLVIIIILALYFTPVWPAVEMQLVTQSTQTGEVFNRLNLADSTSVTTDARTELMVLAWERFLEKPFFGHGGGIPLFGEGESPQGPHNMVLLMLNQYGLLGMGIFIGLIYILARKAVVGRDLTLMTFTVALIIQSMFTHNMFTQGAFAVAISVAMVWPTNSRADFFSNTGNNEDHTILGTSIHKEHRYHSI